MKKMTMTAAILVASISGIVGYARAAERPTVDYGKKLFGDPALGGPGNTKSCNSCHPAGNGLENAWRRPALAEKINDCIGAMKGQGLPMDSAEMKSMILYLQSLRQDYSWK